jgi:hypothetical protein
MSSKCLPLGSCACECEVTILSSSSHVKQAGGASGMRFNPNKSLIIIIILRMKQHKARPNSIIH